MLKEYIKQNWDSCVRNNVNDDATLIGLPYPYIVPSPSGKFNEMYYWDTFFTLKGLLLSGREALAKNCTDNMLYLVERFGFMPNGNRTYYLTQSQPPFLSMMVMDIYKFYKDVNWLKKAYNTLKKEYSFWMTKRITSTGLNQYGVNSEKLTNSKDHYKSICERISYKLLTEDYVEFAENFLADCESGWDFNPRTQFCQKQILYADLNSNLYIYEKNFEYFAKILNTGEESFWNSAAKKRIELINQYLWNGTSFMDYNFVKKEFSSVFSVASFYPLWAEIADEKQAKSTIELLSKNEFEYGVSACEKNDFPGNYQWDYPIGWAPLHYIIVRALDNYGYKKDARRISKKYIKSVERLYKETGNLWEKYNVTDGTKENTADYSSEIMLGWTAGVYLYLEDYLTKEELT